MEPAATSEEAWCSLLSMAFGVAESAMSPEPTLGWVKGRSLQYRARQRLSTMGLVIRLGIPWVLRARMEVGARVLASLERALRRHRVRLHDALTIRDLARLDRMYALWPTLDPSTAFVSELHALDARKTVHSLRVWASREALSAHDIHRLYFAELGVPAAVTALCLDVVEGCYELPSGRLRPWDRVDSDIVGSDLDDLLIIIEADGARGARSTVQAEALPFADELEATQRCPWPKWSLGHIVLLACVPAPGELGHTQEPRRRE